jgi:hypothetical protein
VLLHRLFSRARVTGRDDVEQFLVRLRVAAHPVRPERGCRSAEEMADPAPQLASYLNEEGVVGQAPEVFVKLLVKLVHQGEVVLLSGVDHPVHDCLKLAAGCGREPSLEPAHRELLEHDAQARNLVEHARGQAGYPRSPPWQALHQAFFDQPGQCLAQWDVAHAEPVRETTLDKAVAGGVHPAQDFRAEPVRNSISAAVVGEWLGHVGQAW